MKKLAFYTGFVSILIAISSITNLASLILFAVGFGLCVPYYRDWSKEWQKENPYL